MSGKVNSWTKEKLFNMKFITTWLLLVVASTCLLDFASAGVTGVPVELLENLKLSDDLPEAPKIEEDVIYPRNIYVDVVEEQQQEDEEKQLEEDFIVPEIPEEEIVEPEQRAGGRFCFEFF